MQRMRLRHLMDILFKILGQILMMGKYIAGSLVEVRFQGTGYIGFRRLTRLGAVPVTLRYLQVL
jgi:hypothetical protein